MKQIARAEIKQCGTGFEVTFTDYTSAVPVVTSKVYRTRRGADCAVTRFLNRTTAAGRRA